MARGRTLPRIRNVRGVHVNPLLCLRRAVALLAALTLVACGGGGSYGDGGGGDNAPLPDVSALRITAQAAGPRSLALSWPQATGATFYRVSQRTSNGAAFEVLADGLTATTQTVTAPALHRTDWAALRYRVEACNEAGCAGVDSDSVIGLVAGMTAYLKASNADAGDRFGSAVALSADGSTLAIGAEREDSDGSGANPDTENNNDIDDSGAVYVFVRDGATWKQQAYLKAAQPQVIADFGGDPITLSGDGNTLAVGVSFEDVSGSEDGAVHVFVRNGAVWSQPQRLTAPNGGSSDLFGRAVHLSADGQTLAVGAVAEDGGTAGVQNGGVIFSDEGVEDAGAVYVFARNDNGWALQAYVKSSAPTVSAGFGSAVALAADGSTLAVGASREDGAGGENSGVTYVFVRSGSQWQQQARLEASNAGAEHFFGGALALSADGNTLAVGAHLESSDAVGVQAGSPTQVNAAASSAGAVYLFVRNGAAWTQQAYVKASNTAADDEFGAGVALSADGNTLAVSAPGEDGAAVGAGGDQADNTADGAGAVYVFVRNGATWTQRNYLKASNTGRSDEFGVGLALSADGATLAVGASDESSAARGVGGDQNNEDARDAGAAYVF
jgi:trimeric autotransporter adhesin